MLNACVLIKVIPTKADLIIKKVREIEGIDFELDTLDTYVKATYPDLRKCINTLQMNSAEGSLQAPNTADVGEQDYRIEMVELFKQGKITEARKLLC